MDLSGLNLDDVTNWQAVDNTDDVDNALDSLLLTIGGDTIMIANYFDTTILSADDLSIGKAGVGLIESINFSDASYNFNNVITEDLA